MPPRGAPIVVGADSSYWGQIALRWAAEHAWLAGAVLEVHRPPVPMTNDDRLGRVLRGFPMLPVAVRVGVDPATDLLAASLDADLVVLGCRGNDHHGIGVGSAVTPVASGAACDVMVVGGRPAAVRGAHHQISVLIGTDNDQRALASAAGLAALRRVPLRIMLAAPMVGPHPLRAPVDDHLATLRTAEALTLRLEPAVHTTTEIVWTSPHETVSKIDDTDVLVLGVHERLDAVTRLALHHAVCPVLIARGNAPAHHRVDAKPKAESSAS
ncbi:MAG TPA: universal stress protein [Pseudonocardiaceae bacterium]|nr:universal stress protein [Pseudonocardiaceae bacterium]